MVLVAERSTAERLRTFEAARRDGVAFLLAHLNDDGSIGPMEGSGVHYYRVPWALALAGETIAGMRLVEWICAHARTPEGEISGSAEQLSDASPKITTYAETCLAYGAHLLRRFDVARQTMKFALGFQDAATGGVYMDRERTGAVGPQLLFPTCQLGMSAVMTGDLLAAERAGWWLERLWAAQPNLPDRLYTVWTRDGGLATEVPAGDDRRFYVNESQEVRQFHYNGGIAAAFLTHLYFATGEARWLTLAEAYQRFSMESTQRQFEVKQVCKSAWGAGLLWLATRDRRYREWALRMGDWFVAEQAADGSWANSAYLDPTPSLDRLVEITAEFVVHLDTVMAAVGASTTADGRLA